MKMNNTGIITKGNNGIGIVEAKIASKLTREKCIIIKVDSNSVLGNRLKYRVVDEATGLYIRAFKTKKEAEEFLLGDKFTNLIPVINNARSSKNYQRSLELMKEYNRKKL